MNEFKFTQGEWSQHTMSNPTLRAIPCGDSCFTAADIHFGVGDKIIGEVLFQTPSQGYPKVDSVAEFHANAALIIAAPKLLSALLAVIDATSDYLPPDGISKDECINRVLQATDSPEIFAILQSLRGNIPMMAEAA